MSIEYDVAVDKDRVPTLETLNGAAREMGIPLVVGSGFSDLSRYGFQPVQFADCASGVEARFAPLETVHGVYEVFDSETTDRYDSVLTLTFGSDAREGAAAMGICAALSRTAGALTYSTEDGRFVDEAELTTWMQELAALSQERERHR